jgi:hypothetical protein
MHKLGFIKRFTQWEYWPSYMFYLPNLPYAFYLAIKARNATFYSAVNPAIKNSGNGTESKFKTIELIPNPYKPKTLLVSKKRNFQNIIKQLHQQGIDYPIIVKPDIGFRGMLVEKIYSDHALKAYLEAYPIALIIQEFIDLPQECGIFYHRLPGEIKGKITSLTLKSFLSVKGDGVSSLGNLIKYDARARHYIDKLATDHKDQWHLIPKKEETVWLSAIGNHSRGTQFINGNHLIDSELTTMLDTLSSKIKAWYYGRIDVKYKDFESLKQGKDFYILEINGTISEPTHMYDPYHTTYFKALKTIRQHWKIMFSIAKRNIQNGIKPRPFIAFWKDVMDLKKYLEFTKKHSNI